MEIDTIWDGCCLRSGARSSRRSSPTLAARAVPAGVSERRSGGFSRNLKHRTETLLREAVFPSIASSVAVLRTFEGLLPAAEDADCRARRPRHRQQRLPGAARVRAAVQAGLERAAQAADDGARRARLAGAGGLVPAP
jgi:hypothetical protein